MTAHHIDGQPSTCSTEHRTRHRGPGGPAPVAGQSALHGLLRKVSDLGLPLVSVTPTPDIRTSTAPDLAHPVDDDL